LEPGGERADGGDESVAVVGNGADVKVDDDNEEVAAETPPAATTEPLIAAAPAAAEDEDEEDVVAVAFLFLLVVFGAAATSFFAFVEGIASPTLAKHLWSCSCCCRCSRLFGASSSMWGVDEASLVPLPLGPLASPLEARRASCMAKGMGKRRGRERFVASVALRQELFCFFFPPHCSNTNEFFLAAFLSLSSRESERETRNANQGEHI